MNSKRLLLVLIDNVGGTDESEEGCMRLVLTAVSVAALMSTPVAAQWLNHPTPGIPRTADGKPHLTAPSPRTPDGKPDFNGLWTGQERSPRPDPDDVQPWAKEVARQRGEDFFKTRPMFQCLPSGPETFAQSTGGGVWKRIVQTPSLIVILNDDLTYRRVFMDGRTLEAAPNPSWMGYSVGRWEGEILVVDSVGFNERTWLNNRGLPHTEALRMNERYQRRDVGHLQIDVTFTDPDALTKPLRFSVSMELAADTEMLERVCESGSDRWVGRTSDAPAANISVAPDVLATYVGVYFGFWAGRPRTVVVTLPGGQLVVQINDGTEVIPLVPLSESVFESAEGLGYRFVRNGRGPATHVVEIHVSGDYQYERRR